MLAAASPARALDPGTPVTVTLPDGSLVSGVVQSTAPLSPMGFNTPPPGQLSPAQTATFIGVPVIPVQPFTPEQQKAFLQQQAAEREARRHQVTTPQSDFQFNLQQALDRQAHGLPFNGP